MLTRLKGKLQVIFPSAAKSSRRRKKSKGSAADGLRLLDTKDSVVDALRQR